MLARDEPLSADGNDALRTAFATGAKQGKFDPLRGAVWLGGADERFADAADRARPLHDAAGLVEDPLARVKRLLRSPAVKEIAGGSRGICYPFAGE